MHLNPNYLVWCYVYYKKTTNNLKMHNQNNIMLSCISSPLINFFISLDRIKTIIIPFPSRKFSSWGWSRRKKKKVLQVASFIAWYEFAMFIYIDQHFVKPFLLLTRNKISDLILHYGYIHNQTIMSLLRLHRFRWTPLPLHLSSSCRYDKQSTTWTWTVIEL